MPARRPRARVEPRYLLRGRALLVVATFGVVVGPAVEPRLGQGLGGAQLSSALGVASAQDGAALRRLALSELPASHRRPAAAPAAVVTGPSDGTHVVFLHGWRGCAAILAGSGPLPCFAEAEAEPGWGLGAQVRASGYLWTLVVPQLAFRRRDSSPGRFAREGYATRFLDGVDSELSRNDVGPLVLAVHSAGFATALAWLRHGGSAATRVRAVILFDALYSGTQAFADWALADEGRVLISYHGRGGDPVRQNVRLRRLLSRGGLVVGDALTDDARAFVVRTRVPHADIPARHFAEALDRVGALIGARAREE